LVRGKSFCYPTLYSYASLKRPGGAVRIKCGKVSRLLSLFEGDQGPFSGLFEPIPCATRVYWNTFFYIFKGRLLTTIERKLSFLSNSPEDLYELLPKFQQERHWCFPEVVGILFEYTGLGRLGG